MHQKAKFISRAALAARWSRCARSIYRYEKNPPPGFPKPINFAGRWYFDLEAVEAYERHLASQASMREAA